MRRGWENIDIDEKEEECDKEKSEERPIARRENKRPASTSPVINDIKAKKVALLKKIKEKNLKAMKKGSKSTGTLIKTWLDFTLENSQETPMQATPSSSQYLLEQTSQNIHKKLHHRFPMMINSNQCTLEC